MLFLRILPAFLLLLLAAPSARAETAEELKAAFLVKFASFATWPADAPQDGKIFILGVAGSGEIAKDVERAVEGAKVRGRAVVLRRVNSVTDANECHLVYFPTSMSAHLLGAVRSSPILTVGGYNEFCEQGGMIGIKQIGTKLRFAINKNAARKARIELSAQLLKLALAE
jgi:hypothetical protein